MGALHDGHLSLVRASKLETDFTVVTIFVNPTQFAPGEDLAKYPRTLADDVERLQRVPADLIVAPAASEMYPENCTTMVRPPLVSRLLEGQFRPAHFEGVCTIVLKLFNMVGPDVAYFGQKDFQQVVVVRQMVEDLDMPVRIRTCPTVREPDGLAMSSRNVFLSPTERRRAQSIHQTLKMAEKRIGGGEKAAESLMAEMRQMLINSGISSIDYAVIADPRTLRPVDEIRLPVVILIAVRVGETRLIDNCLVEN
jgi:pantoate--beta-alanine ligase